jgi:hypothetical protein
MSNNITTTATPKQMQEMEDLLLNIDSRSAGLPPWWLKMNHVERWEDMPAEQMALAIDQARSPYRR